MQLIHSDAVQHILILHTA